MTEPTPIDRVDTGIRLVLSLLFVVIAEVVETVLRVLTVFSLLFALVTGDPPAAAVRRLSNQISTYLYRIYRYLTYNESRAPFPFRELPEALEPTNWSGDTTESDLLRRTRHELGRPSAGGGADGPSDSSPA